MPKNAATGPVDTRRKAPSKGWQGAVLKLLGGNDYQLTVTSTEWVTDAYLRLGFTGGGVLTEKPLHPTMWMRLWFEADGKLHQRGYTLVDPDRETDTFTIEFAIHEGTATDWAKQAKPGDTIPATLMGSKFEFPEPAAQGWLIAGDAASLPAINSLLDAIAGLPDPDVPVTIWFEFQHESDRELPLRVRPGQTVHWIERGDGTPIVESVRAAAFAAPGHFGWVALESSATRAVTGILKGDYGIGRKSIKSQAYWIEGKSFA